MKERKAAFGYRIDNEFVAKYYLNLAKSKGLPTPEGPFKKHVNMSLAKNAAWDAGLVHQLMILDARPRGCGAIIAAFYMPGLKHGMKFLPTTRELDIFKACLFLDADDNPKWHILE